MFIFRVLVSIAINVVFLTYKLYYMYNFRLDASILKNHGQPVSLTLIFSLFQMRKQLKYLDEYDIDRVTKTFAVLRMNATLRTPIVLRLMHK